jgi:hypothetical protein
MKIIVAMLFCFLLVMSAQAKDARNLAPVQVNNIASEKRVALIIGNSAYTTSPLKNPVNDAKDVATKLRKLGFEVIERHNLTTKQIGRTLSEFRSKLVPGGIALVFYAGHGLQIKGENYLPTVDAEILAEEDVANQSLAVKQIMDVLDDSKSRLNLVFLDACRNNPYSRSFRSAAGDGLARISAPSGTLISYATRPGSVAQDGDGHNGLYTSKLLAQMDSNLQIELALKQVVTAVKTASQGKQEPWMEGSIEGDFCFAGCQSSVVDLNTSALAPQPIQTAILTPPSKNKGDASSNKLNANSETAQQLELARQTVLVGAFVKDFVKSHPISDEVVINEYDRLKTHLGNEEYHVNHILVASEREAEAIIESLSHWGSNFGKIAKANSKDAGSKEHNGDLGWIPIGDIPTSFVKPFGDALMKLSKGQISSPVHSQFGWHIIRLEDVRKLKLPSMEELKSPLIQRLHQQLVKQMIADLRANSQIKEVNSDETYVIVNDVPIPQKRIDLRVKLVTTEQKGQTDTPELRKAIRDDLVNIELMSQEAVKQGLNQ